MCDWCRLGPSKRVQSSCFSKSTNQNHWKRPVPQVKVELKAPRFLVIVCCLASSLSPIDMYWFSIECAILKYGRF